MNKKQIELAARNMSLQSLRLIVRGIMHQAENDGKKPQYQAEVNQFLNSEWGEFICWADGTEPSYVQKKIATATQKITHNTHISRRN